MRRKPLYLRPQIKWRSQAYVYWRRLRRVTAPTPPTLQPQPARVAWETEGEGNAEGEGEGKEKEKENEKEKEKVKKKEKEKQKEKEKEKGNTLNLIVHNVWISSWKQVWK